LDAARHFGGSPILSRFLRGLDATAFERFLAERSYIGGISVDGIVVLYEEPLFGLLRNIRNAIFGAQVPAIGYVENVQNFLIGRFQVLVANFGFMSRLMRSSNNYQAAALPIRNFNAPELRALVEICRTQALNGEFQNIVTPSMNRLMSLRGPKRRSKYAHIYFKDESRRYFKYGHERHSIYPTGGDHELSCDISGRFRFGSALEAQRHYNVSMGDSDRKQYITCCLPNCHDSPVDTVSKENINMFSNDFHG
jgi:hypothetical protein